jgi:hypothetical protein
MAVAGVEAKLAVGPVQKADVNFFSFEFSLIDLNT